MADKSEWFEADDGAKIRIVDHYDGGKAATLETITADGSTKVHVRLTGKAFDDFAAEVGMLHDQRYPSPEADEDVDEEHVPF